MWQPKIIIIIIILKILFFYNNKKMPSIDSNKRKKRKESVTFHFFFNGDNSFQNKEEEELKTSIMKRKKFGKHCKKGLQSRASPSIKGAWCECVRFSVVGLEDTAKSQLSPTNWF
jgi:hypothetical protein